MTTPTQAVAAKPVREVLDSVILIQLEPRIWSGRKKLRPEDLLNVQAIDLPPTDLASLGAKKIMDLEYIKVFEKLKKRAIRACEISGVRFLGGYAVPLTKAQDIATELDKIEVEFMDEKKTFLDNYENNINAWITAHPDWEHALRSAITPKPQVDAALGFNWQAIQVREPKGKAKALTRGLDKEVNGLSDQLFVEIGTSAKDMLDTALFGKDKVTQKSLHRIRQIRDKLSDMSFLSPNVNPLVATVDFTLAMMPKAGHIEGAQFTALYGLLSLLSDPARAKEHGKLINNGCTIEDAVDQNLLGNTSTAAVSAVVPAGDDAEEEDEEVVPVQNGQADSSAVVANEETPTAPQVQAQAPAPHHSNEAAVIVDVLEDEDTCL